MPSDSVARVLNMVRDLATTHNESILNDLIRELEKLDGDHIKVGDITGSTAVAIGSDIRIAVKQYTLPPDVVERLTALADAMDRQAKDTFHAAGHVRVFLSSPGDVSDERALAVKAIAKLQNDQIYKEKITIEVVAWDKPDDSMPILASKDPQTAINEGLALPSQCDIVVVILWARMGTPLDPTRYEKPNGGTYLSGTEWEFEEALACAHETGRPDVLVYRRIEEPRIGLKDPDREEKIRQFDRVEGFFASFSNPDGSIRQGYNAYTSPTEFGDVFELHLRKLIARVIKEGLPNRETEPRPENASIVPPAVWPPQVSPFPGLRALLPEDAPVYFGRGTEVDMLVKRLADPACRFLTIVGASGSGKSSLVGAGLIPRLAENALLGSADWSVIRFTPDEWGKGDPFDSLAGALIREPLRLDGRGLARRLRESPEALCKSLEDRLLTAPEWSQVLLFIDQFEELFTRIHDETLRRHFTAMLSATTKSEHIRTIITLRADFYHRIAELPALVALLNRDENRTFPLSVPGPIDLYEMITGPAKVAGLQLETNLARRILADTGDNPGALALLAYALQQMYEESHASGGWLTWDDYERVGGVQGAIGEQAEDAFVHLSIEAQAALPRVFNELVEVDERSMATRKRTLLQTVTRDDPACTELVAALVNARLLMTSGAEYPMVEVAHEALFRSWPRLAAWIEEARDDLTLLRQVRIAAALWAQYEFNAAYLWPEERLESVHKMIERLQPEFNVNEHEFTRSEFDRLMEEIDNPATTHYRRSAIGERLAAIGDRRPGLGLSTTNLPSITESREVRLWGDKSEHEGLPDIVWMLVEEGEIVIEDQVSRINSFYIAKYPITYCQYHAFLNAWDGFDYASRWEGLGVDKEHKDMPGGQNRPLANHPAENINWYDAVAFCRWLNARLGWPDIPTSLVQKDLHGYKGIRLPTEWEWQLAATGGNHTNSYPWGTEWDPSKANTIESGLSRTTAVGMYPAGVAPCGALDMAGNVWEWSLNEHSSPFNLRLSGTEERARRGGSWEKHRTLAATTNRTKAPPGTRRKDRGFRLACSAPS